MTQHLEMADLDVASESVVDTFGQVFYYQGRVLRVIHDSSQAEFYHNILEQPWIGSLFRSGLIETWIANDVTVAGAPLVLEHRRVSFDTHPAESTDLVHWQMAITFIELTKKLNARGVLIKDAHPWNLMLDNGDVKYIDFGSLTRGEVDFGAWLNEFYTYFVVPIWLSSGRWKRFSRLYRTEHRIGFGIQLFRLAPIKRWIWQSVFALQHKGASVDEMLSAISSWLKHRRPRQTTDGQWGDYEQKHDALDALSPMTTKQRFVAGIVDDTQPDKVLDCAANKGFFSELAASRGAEVVAFDYEEACVDACLDLARTKNLPITPVWMDFRQPTPRYGLGLCGRDSFSRFRSELVLALGLVHHLCLVQRFPIGLFCEVCMRYSESGIILEYVDPTDIHVQGWDIEIPPDYSLQSFLSHFGKRKWHLSRKADMNENGQKRTLLYFHKTNQERADVSDSGRLV